MALAFINRRLQHYPLRGKPKAIINQLGITRHQLVFQMHRAAIQRDGFDAAMGRQQDCAAWRFIHAARFHADKAVFNQVEPANAIGSAQLIELG